MWFRRMTFALMVLTSIAHSTITDAAVPAKTKLFNQASLSYTDNNVGYTTFSNQVETTIAAVSGVSLTPNENGCNPATDTFSPENLLVKTFILTNGGNESDSFTLAPAVSSGQIKTVAFVTAGVTTPATTMVSPALAPGASTSIVMTIDAATVVAGSQIIASIGAHSMATGTANGISTAIAAQCAIPVVSPKFTDVTKLVNGLPATQSAPGENVTYSIGFTNSGGSVAKNVTVADPLPAGMTYVAGSMKRNGVAVPSGAITLAAGTLIVAVGNVAPNTAQAISFEATVSPKAYDGQSLINVATLSASNAPSKKTGPAAVTVGILNTVFDGAVGAKSPISGATVTLMPYAAPPAHPGGATILGGLKIAPNAKNANPYTTDATGTYALGLAPKQSGSYELMVTAPGFVTRTIKVDITADATATYYSVVATALDGSPLAAIGSFDLHTSGAMTIAATYGIFGNIPMFRTGSVTITKTVDRTAASGGDRLIYTLTAANGTDPLGATAVIDDLPAGIAYAPGTSRLDGVAVEPTREGSHLVWNFAQLNRSHTIVFAAVILPSVADESVLTNVAIVTAHIVTSSTYTVSARATATTNVVAGVFTNRTIITGRVYLDTKDAGRFARGDSGVPGIRIYLEDGETVTTDADGKYNFPSVRPGLHVLRLDQTSIPPMVQAYDNRRIDSERSVRRLVHDIADGGLLQDVNFALKPL